MTKEKEYYFRCWKWDTLLLFRAPNEESAREQYKDKLGRYPGHAVKKPVQY